MPRQSSCHCVVDVNYEEDPVTFLIDALAIDLTTEDGREDEREAMQVDGFPKGSEFCCQLCCQLSIIT
jgi:hypothetical protein